MVLVSLFPPRGVGFDVGLTFGAVFAGVMGWEGA